MVAFFATIVKTCAAGTVNRSVRQSAGYGTRLRLSQVVFSNGHASGSPLAEVAKHALPAGRPS
jgi:hypothetical protein